MIEFTTLIMQFRKKGDKSGWTYIEVPSEIACKIKPNTNKTFRVKGYLDTYPVYGVALLPMGNGSFIMPLNASTRKGISKRKGALLHVKLEVDNDYQVSMPVELEECLNDEAEARDYFDRLNRSNQGYFLKWIGSAKTHETRIKRIEHTLEALRLKIDYGAMLRRIKQNRRET